MLNEEPSKILLLLKVLVDNLNYSAVDHEAFRVPDINADLPEEENDHVSNRGGSSFLNELINDPNNLIDH
jgi:hypothetical protein